MSGIINALLCIFLVGVLLTLIGVPYIVWFHWKRKKACRELGKHIQELKEEFSSKV